MDALNGIVGISGGPCTGKTTLARWLAQALTERGVRCRLLPEPARLLAPRGVRIDQHMRAADYDAFLTAYAQRDGEARGTLAIADRTPVDHFSYLAANANIPEDFRRKHYRAALAQAHRYRLIVYLPIELPLRDDKFRTTSPHYRRKLDRAIVAMLEEVDVPVVTIHGERETRQQSALDAVARTFPGLLPAAPLQQAIRAAP